MTLADPANLFRLIHVFDILAGRCATLMLGGCTFVALDGLGTGRLPAMIAASDGRRDQLRRQSIRSLCVFSSRVVLATSAPPA